MIPMQETMKAVKDIIPIPISKSEDLSNAETALLIVDEVNGFCKVGYGAFAPPVIDRPIEMMISKTNELAKIFASQGLPIIVFKDCHREGQQESTYPPHCVKGSGEEELVSELKWLEDYENVFILEKDCVDGLIAGIQPDGSNSLIDFINEKQIVNIATTGIATDICDMSVVLSLLSVITRETVCPTLKKIAVVTSACTTYDLPKNVAVEVVGLPETAAHPREFMNYVALYMMAHQGAVLTRDITV